MPSRAGLGRKRHSRFLARHGRPTSTRWRCARTGTRSPFRPPITTGSAQPFRPSAARSFASKLSVRPGRCASPRPTASLNAARHSSRGGDRATARRFCYVRRLCLLETLPPFGAGAGNGQWNLGQYLIARDLICCTISRSRFCRRFCTSLLWAICYTMQVRRANWLSF
jgi:hypothetical protein